MIFFLYVAYNHGFALFNMQVIAAIGAFAYFLDKNGSFRNSFSDGWDRILSKHPIPFYYCLGNSICINSYVFTPRWVVDVVELII